MTPEERETMVDRLLDQALASYSQAEPRPGLEERVLANLRSQPQRRSWWMWAMVPVAAAVLIAVGLYVSKRPQSAANVGQVEKPAPSAQPAVPISAAPPSDTAKAQPGPQRKVVARVRLPETPEPRLAVFPAPSRLSPQEELLLRLARNNPDEVRLVAQGQEAQAERVRKFAETGVMPPPEDSITSWQY